MTYILQIRNMSWSLESQSNLKWVSRDFDYTCVYTNRLWNAVKVTSPTTRLFVQQPVQANKKGSIKVSVQIMDCRLFGAKLLSEPMLTYCQFDLRRQSSVKVLSKLQHFHSRKCGWEYHLSNGGHFVSTSMCTWIPRHRELNQNITNTCENVVCEMSIINLSRVLFY